MINRPVSAGSCSIIILYVPTQYNVGIVRVYIYIYTRIYSVVGSDEKPFVRHRRAPARWTPLCIIALHGYTRVIIKAIITRRRRHSRRYAHSR